MKFVSVSERIFTRVLVSLDALPVGRVVVRLFLVLLDADRLLYFVELLFEVFILSIAFLSLGPLTGLHDALQHAEISVHLFSL